jgi:hypothetical protein
MAPNVTHHFHSLIELRKSLLVAKANVQRLYIASKSIETFVPEIC